MGTGKGRNGIGRDVCLHFFSGIFGASWLFIHDISGVLVIRTTWYTLEPLGEAVLARV